MPGAYSEVVIQNTRLLELISYIKSDIKEIFDEAFKAIKDLCEEDPKIVQELLGNETFFEQFNFLKKQKEDLNRAGGSSRDIFSESILNQTIDFYIRLETTYKRTLHGIDIDEPVLTACLDEFELWLKNWKENPVTFIGGFNPLAQYLTILPKERVPPSLRRVVASLNGILNNRDIVINNIVAVCNKIALQLRLALARQFFNDLKKENVISKLCSDEKTLVECLSMQPDVFKRYTALTKYLNVGTVLWAFESDHRNYCEQIKKIRQFSPGVHRLRYYNQALNPAVKINNGLCMGGIFCWSFMSLSPSPLFPTEVMEPNFLEHMESWVSKKMLYHMQLNQERINFTGDLGDQSIFTICTSEPTPWREKTGTIEPSENAETKISAEAYDSLINAIFIDIKKAFEDYPQVTLSVILTGSKSGESAHAIGFKQHISEGIKRYHFLDLNDGEFYTEDFKELQSWFKKYFFELGYMQKKYCSYVLSRICPTDPLSRKSGLSSSDFTKKLPLLFGSLVQNKEEGKNEDEKYQQELLHLGQVEEDDEEMELRNNQKILALYKKIKEKSEVNHMIALVANGGVVEHLEKENSSHHQIIECINRQDEILEQLKAMKKAYGNLELVTLFQKGYAFLKYPSLEKKEEAILALRSFCEKVLVMKDDFILLEEDKKQYLELHSKIQNQLVATEVEVVEMLVILEEGMNIICGSWYCLHRELSDLRDRIAVPCKMDNIALEEETGVPDDEGDIELPELECIMTASTTNPTASAESLQLTTESNLLPGNKTSSKTDEQSRTGHSRTTKYQTLGLAVLAGVIAAGGLFFAYRRNANQGASVSSTPAKPNPPKLKTR